MGPTLIPETSAFKLQTPGKFPEEYKLHSEHGESLKTTIRVYVKNLYLNFLQHSNVNLPSEKPNIKRRPIRKEAAEIFRS